MAGLVRIVLLHAAPQRGCLVEPPPTEKGGVETQNSTPHRPLPHTTNNFSTPTTTTTTTNTNTNHPSLHKHEQKRHQKQKQQQQQNGCWRVLL